MSLHVVFRVADAHYTVPASEVLRMESYAGATKVPGAAPHVAGIVQIRGMVVPVVDLRARFALPPSEPTIDSRVVVLQVRERVVGLLVDAAREVVAVADDAFQPPPDVVADQSARFVKSVVSAGGRLLMLIDSEKVIGEEKLQDEQRR